MALLAGLLMSDPRMVDAPRIKVHEPIYHEPSSRSLRRKSKRAKAKKAAKAARKRNRK